MTVKLTSNFFGNARGLTLLDGGGITWALNKNTNEVSAIGTSGSVLSAVGFADTSSAPIYSVANSPLTANGTISITLNTQSAGLVFSGPGTGTAAQPTFRALVATDIPTISYTQVSGLATVAHTGAYGDLSSPPSIPAGGNPTAKVGLAAVNGSALTWMRSDGSPALDVSIAPTWTGGHTWARGTAGDTITINAKGANYGVKIIGDASQPALFGIQDGQTGTRLWAIYAGLTAVGTLDIRDQTRGGVVLSCGTTGAVTVVNTFAINNGTPTAQLTGFGSPSGTPTGGLTNASTLAQTAGTLAALLAYLKTIGFIGA